MQQLATVKLTEDVEDAGNLATHRALGPSLFLPMQVGDQITMLGVLEHQVVDDGRVPAHVRKGVEHSNRARMVVEQLAEVRLAQPSVDPRADLETHRGRDDRRLSKPRCEIHLSEAPFTDQPLGAVAEMGFRTLDHLARVRGTDRRADVRHGASAWCGSLQSKDVGAYAGGPFRCAAPVSRLCVTPTSYQPRPFGPLRTIVLLIALSIFRSLSLCLIPFPLSLFPLCVAALSPNGNSLPFTDVFPGHSVCVSTEADTPAKGPREARDVLRPLVSTYVVRWLC